MRGVMADSEADDGTLIIPRPQVLEASDAREARVAGGGNRCDGDRVAAGGGPVPKGAEGGASSRGRAAKAYDAVLEHAGATRPQRDAVDRRVIDEVRTGKVPDGSKEGIITDVRQ